MTPVTAYFTADKRTEFAPSLSMQKRWVNLIISLAIFVAAGCSFKKEKLVQTDAVDDSAGKIELTLSSFSNKSDEEVILHFSTLTNDVLEKEGALDWSILANRFVVVSYLLGDRNVSPFAYSEQSAHVLATNSKLKSLIFGFQEPEIIN